MGRRGFLGLTAAAGTSVALAGCSSGGFSRGGVPQAGPPRPGGRLRAAFAGGGAKETLDPHRANLFSDIARAKALYDKLADFGSGMAAEKRLARDWSPSVDLTRWRVTLREAAFHDGRPVRATDVLSSYARILDPRGGRRARASLSVIDLPNSRAVDKRTVEFALRRPYADFPNALATLGAYIIPEGTSSFERPVGSGPFVFDSFTPGRSLLVRRNLDYWDGAPLLDELEIVDTNDESARINALIGGQIEYAHDLSPTTARTQAATGQVRVLRLPNSGMQALAMKVDRPPFDQVEVRQAMFHLADRQELVDSVLQGMGQVGNDLFGKGYEYYADGIPQRHQDLDRAKWLLRKAGARNLTVGLETSDAAPGLREAAIAFADQAKRAGVTVRVNVGDKDSYWSDIRDTGALASYRSGAMPIESHISQRLLTNSSTNLTYWKRPDFDALYQQAQSTSDQRVRQDLYLRMQQMLHAEGGFLVWGFPDWIVATAGAVGGVDDTAPANTLNWARFDKVWLAQ